MKYLQRQFLASCISWGSKLKNTFYPLFLANGYFHLIPRKAKNNLMGRKIIYFSGVTILSSYLKNNPRDIIVPFVRQALVFKTSNKSHLLNDKFGIIMCKRGKIQILGTILSPCSARSGRHCPKFHFLCRIYLIYEYSSTLKEGCSQLQLLVPCSFTQSSPEFNPIYAPIRPK